MPPHGGGTALRRHQDHQGNHQEGEKERRTGARDPQIHVASMKKGKKKEKEQSKE
jgi:hypothetical protein